RATIETLLRWLAPVDVSMRWRALAVVLAAGVALVAIVEAARRGARPRVRRMLWRCLPFTLFAALYLLYLIVASSRTALDPIDSRLIAPVLPALIVCVVAALYAVGGAHGRGATIWRAALPAVALLWLLVSAGGVVRFVRQVDDRSVDG